jgi:hypothetical protein
MNAVDECQHDGPVRHRCGDHGDLASRKTRCAPASFRSEKPIGSYNACRSRRHLGWHLTREPGGSGDRWGKALKLACDVRPPLSATHPERSPRPCLPLEEVPSHFQPSGPRARFHADVAEQGRGVLGDEAGAFVGEPFGGFGQHVDSSEAVLHGGDHEVLHVLALMPSVVATWAITLRSQQSRAKATRTFSLLSQPISKSSEHHLMFERSTATRSREGDHRPLRYVAPTLDCATSSPCKRAWLRESDRRANLSAKSHHAHGSPAVLPAKVCKHRGP